MKDPTVIEKRFSLEMPLELGVFYCGKRMNTPDHKCGPKTWDHYIFVLVNSGNAVLYGETNQKLNAHDLLIMFPGERIHYEAVGSWSIQWVGVCGNRLDLFLKELGFSPKKPIMRVERYYDVQDCLNRIYDAVDDSSSAGKLYSTSLLYEFMALLICQNQPDPCEDYVLKAAQFMKHHYSHPISVCSIAEKLHINAAYFSRVFTKEMGISPKQYLMTLRLDCAKELLKNSTISIGEVAYSSGFSDRLYFSKLFCKKTGMSPRQYRDQFHL